MSKLNIIQPALTSSSAIAPTTYSGLSSLTPSLYTGQIVLVTDVGVDGSVFTSNGTKWIPPAKIQLINGGAGWIVPSLITGNAATYSQTGATITVTSTGHNIPAAENGGFVYLAIASGAATAGWFSDYTWVSANSFTCTSLESLSTSGIVSTNLAETVVTPLTKTLLGGLLGKNGALNIHPVFVINNSAGQKIRRIKLDGVEVYYNFGATATQFQTITTIRNRGNYAKQLSTSAALIATGVNNNFVYPSTDTTIDKNLSFTLQCAAASDYICLQSIYVEIAPNDN